MARTSKTWKSKGIEVKKDDKITSNNLADYIIQMTDKDINYDFIMNTFGNFGGKSLCNPYDLLEVPAHTFKYVDESVGFPNWDETNKLIKYNKQPFVTTIGIYLFNLFLAGFGFSKLFNGYLNETIDKKKMGSIEQTLSYAFIEDDITVEQLKQWENTMQWFMPFEDILSPNHTEKLITCTKAVNKKKEELLKKYAAEIEAGDIKVVENIEKELLNFAKSYIGDDPAIDTILSGAGGSFGNNFKNMFVMKGAVRNPDPNAKKKFNIVTGNYLDGIPADEYAIIAGSGAAGAYSRANKTETGGYREKLFVSAYQHIQLDPKGSDCGTTHYIEVDFDEKNIKDYMYSYAIVGNSLELITSKNYKKFIGKKTKLRFSSLCKSKTGICNMCAGELLYAGAANIGMVMAQIPSTLKLRCMKGFHDSTIKTITIDPMKAFFPFQ